MAGGRSDVVGTGLERIESEQVINAQETRNALPKQFIRKAKIGDTTPSVLNVERLEFRNTGALLVVAFDDGQEGQKIEVLGDGNTTVENNTKIVTADGADLLLETGVVYGFTRYSDGKWHQSSGGGAAAGGAGVASFNGRSGAVVPVAGDYPPAFIGAVPASHLTDPDPHTQYQKESEKGVANGYASLDATGKVPASQLPAAAAIPRWILIHPDTPPATPTLFGGVSYDLEFGAASPPGLGTAFGTPANAPSIVDNALKLWSPASAANVFAGVEYPCPPGGTYNFTMIVKFRRLFQLEQYSVSHIGLRANASGAGRIGSFLQVHRNTGTWDETDGSVERWTDPNTSLASINDNTPLPTIPAWYYKLQWTGTNLLYSWSMDGYPDSYRLFVNETFANAFNSQAPGRVNLGCRSLNVSVPAVVYIEYVRFF